MKTLELDTPKTVDQFLFSAEEEREARIKLILIENAIEETKGALQETINCRPLNDKLQRLSGELENLAAVLRQRSEMEK